MEIKHVTYLEEDDSNPKKLWRIVKISEIFKYLVRFKYERNKYARKLRGHVTRECKSDHVNVRWVVVVVQRRYIGE